MRIGIIGHFGGNQKFNDGQTVKTQTIYNALKRYGVSDIDRVDTYYIKKNPLKFCGLFVKSVFYDQKYIVLLSDKGRHVLFPILYFLSKYLKKEIYHYGIGGRLAKEVRENVNWKKYISNFKGNWVESKFLASQLNGMGIENAIYLPNFKLLSGLTSNDLPTTYKPPFKLCIFSRVMKEKGVEDAVAAVEEINHKRKCSIAELDIYGPIEKGYEEHFNSVIDNAPSCKYCGVVPMDKSVEVLKDYYALLFPTHWRHEGIPGSIIDALSAGVPVISRKWKYCEEMLEHGKTGYIYTFEEPERLIEMIEYAIDHVKETIEMKGSCLKKAEQYSEAYVMKIVVNQMGI